MKFKKLTILILATMFFGSSLLANSNKFVFNGLKLGDSLLKNYDKLEIEPNTLPGLPSDKYFAFQEVFKEPIDGVHAFTAYYKPKDKKYRIQGMILNKTYLNGESLEDCRKDMDNEKNKYADILKVEKKLIQDFFGELNSDQRKIWKTLSDNKFKTSYLLVVGKSQQYYDALKIECLLFTDEYKNQTGEKDRLAISLIPHLVGEAIDKQREQMK